MTNPYEELGVDPKADKATIRKAYKRKAQKAHPDKGGDSGAFQRLNAAHTLLTDDTARERFDTTGQTSPEPENSLLSELASLMLQTISQTGSVDRSNIVEAMRAHLKGCIQNVQNQKGQISATKQKFLTAASRLKVKAGAHNLLLEVLNAEVAKTTAALVSAEQVIARLWKLIDMVDDYTYEVSTTSASTFTSPFHTSYI